MTVNLHTPFPVKEYDFFAFPSQKSNIAKEVLFGLSLPQKRLDPKFFYDARGSDLYEAITKTDDYYVTRTENDILRDNAMAIAAVLPRNATVIEPGAGNCKKIEYLLGALRPDVYMPIDVSSEALDAACARLATKYVWLDCVGIVSDFANIEAIAELIPNRRRVAFFPGSTLGNMEPAVAIQFLGKLRKIVAGQGGILIGIDNVKDENVLNRAYNDSDGITAEFNKNILLSLNDTVGTDFSPDNFEHVAFFNSQKSRIEMHLKSKYHQIVRLEGEPIFIEKGETIHTESSYKYTEASFRGLAAKAGLRCAYLWQDKSRYFSLYYLVSGN